MCNTPVPCCQHVIIVTPLIGIIVRSYLKGIDLGIMRNTSNIITNQTLITRGNTGTSRAMRRTRDINIYSVRTGNRIVIVSTKVIASNNF